MSITLRAGQAPQEDQRDGQTQYHMVARDGDVQDRGNNNQNKTMVSRGRWMEDCVMDKLPTSLINIAILFLVGQNGNGFVASKALLQIPYQNQHDHQQQEEHHQD